MSPIIRFVKKQQAIVPVKYFLRIFALWKLKFTLKFSPLIYMKVLITVTNRYEYEEDYYFGIDSNEVNGDKITKTYSGEATYRIGIGILGNYRINDAISLMGFTGVTKLSKEISNSPIVDNDVIYIFGTGVIYTF